MDFNDKTAIVTGAARGIGAACARLLAQKNAEVIVADINLEAAENFCAELKSENLRAYPYNADISKQDSVDDLFNYVKETFGKLDFLVNNAGIIDKTPIPDMSIMDWQPVIDVNLTGTHLCSQAAVKIMMENSGGGIVNIASLAGQVGGLKVSPDYSATKAGIICLAKSYARFGAKYNIRANAVCPGFIETEMTKGRDDPSSVPLLRLGTPLDVANAVCFLLSDMSSYITGATIDVNGGLLMR